MAKQAGMTVAVALVGVGLILNVAGRFIVGDNTAHAAPIAAKAGPAVPTIVWYGSDVGVIPNQVFGVLYRAWSDGTVEVKRVMPTTYPGGIGGDDWCPAQYGACASPWFVVSSPTEGLSAVADNNFDAKVDGADLATLLAAWGPAPRNATPPSDCPLNLVNP